MSTLAELIQHLSILVDDTAHSIWPYVVKVDAVNMAISSAYPFWYEEHRALPKEFILCVPGRTRYPLFINTALTTPIHRILRVERGRAVVAEGKFVNGFSASGTHNTTLNLGADVLNSGLNYGASGRHYFAMTGGGYAGMFARIATNTASQVTVDDTDGFWPIGYDIADFLKVTNEGYPLQVLSQLGDDTFTIQNVDAITWEPLWRWRVDVTDNPSYLEIDTLPAGTFLRLTWAAPPSTLTQDTDETDVAAPYIIFEAAALLYLRRMQKSPAHENPVNSNMFATLKAMADEAKRAMYKRSPITSIRMEWP